MPFPTMPQPDPNYVERLRKRRDRIRRMCTALEEFLSDGLDESIERELYTLLPLWEFVQETSRRIKPILEMELARQNEWISILQNELEKPTSANAEPTAQEPTPEATA